MTDETPDPPKDETPEPPKDETPSAPPDPDPEPPKSDDMPDWAKEIKGQIDAVQEQVAALTPTPHMPGDGGEVPDESPVKLPWTHRGFFKKG